jgi:hypothetical protein
MGDERKERSARVPVLVDCHVEGFSARTSMRITDLSATGGYVECRAYYQPGDRMQLTVMLDGRDVMLTGRVVHNQPGIGFGFTFDEDLPDDARKAVENFVNGQ